MFSAVTYPQPSPPPAPPQPSVRELAAAGYFRAIALWLNEPLAAQGIYVKVQSGRPGCLRLIVEFERPPLKERLLRFLCHRVWLLNSDLIEGIHVVARPVGRRRTAWEKRIRIVTPALKRRKAVIRIAHPARQNSPLPPQIRQKVVHLSNQHLKTLRSLLLTGSAVAAFIFGCLLEVVMSGAAPVLPSFSAKSLPPAAVEEAENFAVDRPDLIGDSSVTTIDYRANGAPEVGGPPSSNRSQGTSPTRPTVVDAALEPVGVIQHHLPEGAQSEEVTLLFGGDLSLEHLDYSELPESGGLFTEVEEYLQADLSMVTLASPLASAATTLEEELYQRNRPEAVNVLADSGIDIVNLTNNNLMEYGTQGLDETLKVLDSKGLYRVGAGRNETEARRPEVIDVKGKRIAYLSYSMGGDRAAFDDRAGTNAQEMKEIVEDIQALRDEVDWIVVNYRWMDFVAEEPNFKQTNLARLAIDQGADVVVGYHPNVIQGAEVYKGRPIAYSVGDFVFETDSPIADQDSAMLKVSLHQDQMKIEFVPVRVQNSLPHTLEGSEGKVVLDKIEQVSQQFEKPMKSPMVLDLKEKAPTAPEEYDPDTPFVSPEASDTLPVEPQPAEPEPSVESVEPTELEKPETPSAVTDPKQDPAPAVPSTQPDAAKPLPETLDLLEQFDDNLLEWGPKPSNGQQEFRPIPQNLQDAKQDEIDANLQPGLLRRGQPSHRPSGDQGLEIEPSPLELDELSPEPTPAEENPAPAAPPPAAEPAEPPQAEAVAEPEQSSIPEADDASKAISPHSEPLVGPLSAIEKPHKVQPEKQIRPNLISQLSHDGGTHEVSTPAVDSQPAPDHEAP